MREIPNGDEPKKLNREAAKYDGGAGQTFQEIVTFSCRALMRGWELSDPWFYEWYPIIVDVVSAIEVKKSEGMLSLKWNHLPFGGGIYDQKRINSLTWEIWQMIARTWMREMKDLMEESNGGNDAQD